MINYWFRPVEPEVLTEEPALLAILITFVVTVLAGMVYLLISRRLRAGNPLASKWTGILGQTLFWVGVWNLFMAFCFWNGVLFNWRAWLVLGLLAIYAVLGYATYYYLTRYQELVREQQAERERRRRFVPAPAALGPTRPGPATGPATRVVGGKRRRRTRREG